MRRFKSAFSPYVSDAVAFALLGVSLAVVIAGGMASITIKVEQARMYHSIVPGTV